MTAITEERFRDLVVELVDENPFAIRPVLKILDIVFTKAVPTLAVTCEARPRLLVNLEFLNVHCRTDQHIKAVICHEFLHVVLRHTETRRPFTPARHLALDAVINAVIHRQYGDAYSSMMAGYYGEADDLKKLLRPMTLKEQAYYGMCRSTKKEVLQWARAWAALYDGELVADDIETLAQDMSGAVGDGPFDLLGGLPNGVDDLLGDHDTLGRPLPQELQDALDRALRQMNGSGIWRSPRDRGVGANPYEALFVARNEPMRRWERRTLEILKQHLSPDRHSRTARLEQAEFRVPVLSPRDRRAFMRARWAPFLPEAEWRTEQPKREGTAQVYLDVSGSMSAEMPVVIALLGRLSRYTRRPFWAFSDVVAPAIIEHGRLMAQTTGGTSLACVLEHMARTRPASAVVVTDGYIENLDRRLVMKASATRLHVVVTRDGSPKELLRAGLPYTQLERIPS
jgi:predicted metal-dependent peptidase